jgi:hemerythrin-like domain-containing protein
MIDGIKFLDDATRPMAPKLEGLTEAQREPGRHLAQVHDHLRDNMRVLGKLIERASAGEVSPAEVAETTADMTMLANFRRFGNLCGQHCAIVEQHHSIEDYAVFPPLAAKSEALRRVTERLAAEHVVVHELLVRLMDALQVLALSPSHDTFTAAKAIYETLERVLLSHLGYEEDQIGDALGYYGIV